MGDVLTFKPRPKPAAPPEPEAMTEAQVRARLGEALQTALDAADHIIAVLDRLDGDADLEDGADAEPSLAAPENHHASQVTWLRGNDRDREGDAPELVVPVLAVSPAPKLRIVGSPEPLPWGGSGNVVAAAGAALLDLLGHG